MSESLKDKSLAAFLWVLIDKMGGSVANFIVTVMLARLLTPEDFGLVAMVMVFFELSSSFIQSGIGFALIREKTITDADKSTAFIFNFLTALAFYGILFLAAPAIAAFFAQPALKNIVRVMGLNLIVGSLALVQHAELTHRIDFKTQTKVRIIGVLVSGACAVGMAFAGCGVWSLVARIGIMELSTTVLFWLINPWKIALHFNRKSFRKLFGFGSVILAEALIDKFFRQLVQLLIGKFFSAATLGFFTQANTFCNMAATNFLQTIQRVTYPVLAKMQDDRGKLKDGYRRLISMSSFVIIPVMVLTGVIAEPLLVTVVGEKWRPSAPFLQLLCIGGAVYHINSINLDMLLVLGRVDLSLKLEIIKKAITALAIIIGIQFGIYGLIAGQLAATYIALFINTWYSDKLLRYSLYEQLKDVAPSVAFSLLAGLAIAIFQKNAATNALYFVLIAPLAGIGLYLGFHAMARTREMALLKSFIIPQTRKLFSL